MANTNDFVPWATDPAANVLSPTLYAALATRSLGFQTGIVPSPPFNTILRQSSFVASGLAKFMADYGNANVADDGNLVNFEANLIAAMQAAIAPTLRGYLSGFQLSNDGGLPLTVIDIGAGEATSDDALVPLMASGSMAKSVGAWASGSSVGGLDTGLISANTWYAMYAIDGPVAPVDFLMSASYTAPVMPTGYTKKRYIGSIKTDGASHILPFTQNQDCFLWTTPTLDIATATLGVASALFPLNVPHSTTFKVDAIIRGWASNAVTAYLLISSPDTADLAPNTPAGNITAYLALTGGWGELRVRVDASGQVRLRASATSTTVNGLTVGWYDQRGKN